MKIAINNLSKSYRHGSKALDVVSLTIESGMFGLLGHNGAGKTTLMRIIATLMEPTNGQVLIDDLSVVNPKHKLLIRQQLGYLPQDITLYGGLSAYDFLDFIATMKKIGTSQQRRQHIESVLDTTSLTAVADKKIKDFSGGMKRRVGIAQALLGNPTLLIVDEPTVGLDPQERVRFRNLLVALAQQRIVILSSHILEDIAQTCPVIGILNQGILTFHGTPDDLLVRVRGCIWEFEATQYVADEQSIIVTTIPTQDKYLYRVLAAMPPHPNAQPTTPTLEESYLWHMQPH